MAKEGEGIVLTETESQEKSPEQLAAERLKRYQENPKDFVEISELVCAAMKHPKSSLGISVMVGNVPRSALDIAQTELNHMINKIRLRMDITAEMKNAPKIQQPGAMHRFANKIIGR